MLLLHLCAYTTHKCCHHHNPATSGSPTRGPDSRPNRVLPKLAAVVSLLSSLWISCCRAIPLTHLKPEKETGRALDVKRGLAQRMRCLPSFIPIWPVRCLFLDLRDFVENVIAFCTAFASDGARGCEVSRSRFVLLSRTVKALLFAMTVEVFKGGIGGWLGSVVNSLSLLRWVLQVGWIRGH